MSPALQQHPACEQEPLAGPAYAKWRSPAGEVAATFHRHPDGYLVRFRDCADFVIALDRGTVTCAPVPGVAPQMVEDIFLNQVMPMIRGQEGGLIIHASAVTIADGIVGFMGSTGRGKSTLAAAFARRGFPFLSDDGLTLTVEDCRYIAHPNRPTFRLWQDSQWAVLAGREFPPEYDDEKTRVVAGESLPFQARPLPLRALYLLGTGDSAAPRIEPLSQRQAVAELMNHSFLLDVEDRLRLKRHFDTLAQVGEAVPCFSLDYPRIYGILDEVIGAVVDHSAKGIGVS